MPENWSRGEVEAIVSDHFTMLLRELQGESFNKSEHRRRLRERLNNRSDGSVEFKHANISAVLLELGFPYIDGYKPRSNAQDLLRAVVAARLQERPDLLQAAAHIVDAPAVAPKADPMSVFVDPPVPEHNRAAEDRQPRAPLPALRVNYLEREARNRALGLAGERFVLELEHQRLWEAGKRRLAERIDHVSQTRGDGEGYDIQSFDVHGRVRMIEVKTTRFGIMTPFFATRNEVSVSDANRSEYRLYRIFDFGDRPRLFVLEGAIRDSVVLDPAVYRASFG